MTTLKTTEGATTTGPEGTMKMIAEQLIPKDDDTDDTDCHKQTRAQSKEQKKQLKIENTQRKKLRTP
jgi:hypothetical protein